MQAGIQQASLGAGKCDSMPAQLLGGHALDQAVAAQHVEVSTLRDQMALLRQEMTAMRHGSAGHDTVKMPRQQVRSDATYPLLLALRS